jgi:glutamate N-acetyltransferase/amino-acid N-acetyltransferase
MIMENITCPGFTAAGIAAGLKKNREKDLGLIFSKVPASVAGVFTNNRVQAAPVRLDKERIKSGLCQAVIVNSGNANCCTGDEGMQNARIMAELAASNLNISENLVLVASTGVIGKPLPIEKIEAVIRDLVNLLKPEGIADLARAIMTTDSVPKWVSKKGILKGHPFTVTGVAKGSGMISPDMATMLCFVCSDIGASPDLLKSSLSVSVDQSFNRITVDGDTSTNDTVILMANGLSEAVIKTEEDRKSFQYVLDDVLMLLAEKIVRDGEGATKLIRIEVKGALSHSDARRIADTIADSNLVKTAFFGEDANWGRILAAAGRAGVSFDPDSTDIFFDEVLMVRNGMGRGEAAEVEATRVLKKPEFTVLIDLKSGSGQAFVLTCDFSVDYVKINAEYRS